MIISDFVECEGCGTQIEHIGTHGDLQLARQDADYKLCDDCRDEAIFDEDDDEEDFDPENIYIIPSMRQSIEEDRSYRRG